ncbi:uridine kinase [bacterium]|jgi:uridine kinase|nr:uridine kinase [bacterium]
MKNQLVGLCGGTAAGKTTIVSKLIEHYGSASTIQLDSYYKDFSSLSFDNRKKVNFDHPDSFNTKMLKKHLSLLLEGNKIESPIYNYKTHCRENIFNIIYPNKLIFLEGTLIFFYSELTKLMMLKIFIETPEDIRFKRRLKRDVKKRGRLPIEVRKQYNESVKPMHMQYIEPLKSVADIIISGSSEIDASVEKIIKKINSIKIKKL